MAKGVLYLAMDNDAEVRADIARLVKKYPSAEVKRFPADGETRTEVHVDMDEYRGKGGKGNLPEAKGDEE